jgi:Activator of Hsp90 ATPase homolog 1-like protein
VEFRERGEQTELRLVHTEFPAGHRAAPYRMGWDGGLDKLERLVAGLRVDA